MAGSAGHTLRAVVLMISMRNLLRAPARSLLTVVGISAGIALFVALLAITTDIHEQVASAARGYGFEVIVYERRATSPFSSHMSRQQFAQIQARPGSSAIPVVLGTRNEPWNPYVLIIGVPLDFLHRIPIRAGSPFRENEGEAIIGEVAASELGTHEGQIVSIDGSDVDISGVFRTGSRLLDGGFMMDMAQAQRVLSQEGQPREYSLAVLQAGDSEASTAALVEDINENYPDLKAIPGTEFAGSMRLMRVVDAFVKTLAVLALVGTCLVVINTVLMAIGQRTREIGILMTMGWTPWLVLRMFFAECVVLCLAGAALGNGLGLLLLRVVNSIESIGFGWIPIKYPLSLAMGSFALAFAVAVVSLAWPAVILLRVQPLAALRQE